MTNIGALEIMLRQFDKAQAHLDRAAQIDPSNPNTWSNLGVARRARGDSDGAEAAYKKAIEIDPNLAEAYLNYGIFLEEVRQDRKGAIAQYSRYWQVAKNQSGTNPRVPDWIDALK